MELIKNTTNIDFMGQRKIAAIVSAILIVISIASLATRGLNFGLDFTGGTLIEVVYDQGVDLADVRSKLSNSGFDDALVQTLGNDRELIIRLPSIDSEDNDQFSERVLESLRSDGDNVEKRRVDFIGPQVGEELAEQGGMAMLIALIGTLLYILVRFQWKFSVGAVSALVHDVIITLGLFSVFQYDFDLTVLAAILAVIGYSLNDTIVVYDRVRENFRTMRRGEPVGIFNTSINQMLARTLVTSLTTLLVLMALFFLGGGSVHNFARALMFGVVIGTYSSIYVAGTALLALDVTKQDLMPVEKEGADLKHIP